MAEEMQPAPATQACDEEQLAGIVRGLVGEVHPGGASVPAALDSRLEADLGLDSLVLVELRSRVEDAFGVVLPDRILGGATPGEWLQVLRAAGAAPARRFPPAGCCGRVPASPGPAHSGRRAVQGPLPCLTPWRGMSRLTRVAPASACCTATEDESSLAGDQLWRLSAGASAVAVGLRGWAPPG